MPKDQSFYFSTSPRLSTSSRAKAWAVHSKTWTDSSVTLSSETTQLRLDLVLLTLSNLTPSALVSLIIFLNSFLSTMVLVVSLVPPKSGVPPGLLTPSHLTFSSLSCTSRASILSRSESITPSNFSRSFSISTVSRLCRHALGFLLQLLELGVRRHLVGTLGTTAVRTIQLCLCHCQLGGETDDFSLEVVHLFCLHSQIGLCSLSGYLGLVERSVQFLKAVLVVALLVLCFDCCDACFILMLGNLVLEFNNLILKLLDTLAVCFNFFQCLLLPLLEILNLTGTSSIFAAVWVSRSLFGGKNTVLQLLELAVDADRRLVVFRSCVDIVQLAVVDDGLAFRDIAVDALIVVADVRQRVWREMVGRFGLALKPALNVLSAVFKTNQNLNQLFNLLLALSKFIASLANAVALDTGRTKSSVSQQALSTALRETALLRVQTVQGASGLADFALESKFATCSLDTGIEFCLLFLQGVDLLDSQDVESESPLAKESVLGALWFCCSTAIAFQSVPTLLPDSTLLDSSKMRLDMLVSTEGPTNMSSCLLQERQNTITSGQLSEAGSYHKLVRNETEKRNLAHQTATPQSTCNQQRNVSSTVMTICLNAITQPCARYIHSAWVGVSCRQQPQSIQDALASKPQKEMPVALYLPSMRTITALGRETEEQQELTLGEIPDSNSWTRAVRDGPQSRDLLRSHASRDNTLANKHNNLAFKNFVSSKVAGYAIIFTAQQTIRRGASVHLWQHDSLTVKADSPLAGLTSGLAYVNPLAAQLVSAFLLCRYPIRSSLLYLGTLLSLVPLHIVLLQETSQEHNQVMTYRTREEYLDRY
ncbi:hypothetical protein KCV06_g645, partial [Aureobasidium melanogenum]